MKTGPKRSDLRMCIEFMTEGHSLDTGRPNSREGQDAVGQMCRKQGKEDGRTYKTHQNQETGTIWVKCVSEWEE